MSTTLTITTSRPNFFLQDGGTGGKSKKKKKKGSAQGRRKWYEKPTGRKYTNSQEDIRTLFTNKSRVVIKDGKEFLVVPGVPVQEQVMNTYLLPADEIKAEAWIDTPVSIRHPQKNNGSVQVDEPDVPVIGYIANTSWDSKTNRMLGEYWIDLGIANKYPEGQLIVTSIKNGEMIETSTAYWADEQYASGNFKGRDYKTIHRNLRPDHVAVFPFGQAGACSIADGCGVNRNMKHNCNCMQHNVTGNLPAVGKAIWEEVYEDNEDKGEESAAKIAWAAVKQAGWYKKGEEWVKSNNYDCPPYKKNHLPTDLLIGYSFNKGSRTQGEIESAREYIKTHGVTKPIWVQVNGSITILDGNHRVQIADELEIEQVPVRVVDRNLIPMDPEAVYTKWVHEKDQGYLS